jgi:hypothetical protein
MVSYYVLAASVMLTGGVSLLLGYRLGNSSAGLLITWLKEKVLTYQAELYHWEVRCYQAEDELARERALPGKGGEG